MANYFFINTDSKSLGKKSPHDKWFEYGYAFTGGPIRYGEKLGRFSVGDTVLMYANGIGVYQETAICETPATTKINFWQDNCEVNLMVEKRGYEPAVIPVTKDSDLKVSCTLQKIEGVEENKFSKEFNAFSAQSRHPTTREMSSR
jgi:hypothetical protein